MPTAVYAVLDTHSLTNSQLVKSNRLPIKRYRSDRDVHNQQSLCWPKRDSIRDVRSWCPKGFMRDNFNISSGVVDPVDDPCARKAGVFDKTDFICGGEYFPF